MLRAATAQLVTTVRGRFRGSVNLNIIARGRRNAFALHGTHDWKRIGEDVDSSGRKHRPCRQSDTPGSPLRMSSSRLARTRLWRQDVAPRRLS